MQSNSKRALVEQYLEEDIVWLTNAASQNKQTDIRLRQASSQLIKSLSLWHQDGRLLFPERETSTRVYDYLFLNNQHRMKKLLDSASPTAWERYDINTEALLYCKKGTISICLFLDTSELLAGTDLSEEALFSALFSDSDKTTLWWAFAYCVLFLILLPILRLRFLKRKAPRLQAENNNTFKMGDMVIDPQRMSICREALTANISERDLKILTYLVEHPGAVITKDKLYNAGWGRSYLPNSRSLEQHIMTLRKKIDPDRTLPVLIETVHGQGYRFPANQL